MKKTTNSPASPKQAAQIEMRPRLKPYSDEEARAFQAFSTQEHLTMIVDTLDALKDAIRYAISDHRENFSDYYSTRREMREHLEEIEDRVKY